MKQKIIVLAVIFLLCTLIFKTSESFIAEAKDFPEKTIWREEELLLLAEKYANIHGVSSAKVKQIVICEAPWLIDKDGIYTYKGGRYYNENDAQSRIRYNAGQIARNPDWGEVGEREKSFGPGQIHEPAHPNITREQAVDPDFTLDFMAEMIAEGKSGMWTCSGN